jgi:hypothetical protein
MRCTTSDDGPSTAVRVACTASTGRTSAVPGRLATRAYGLPGRYATSVRSRLVEREELPPLALRQLPLDGLTVPRPLDVLVHAAGTLGDPVPFVPRLQNLPVAALHGGVVIVRQHRTYQSSLRIDPLPRFVKRLFLLHHATLGDSHNRLHGLAEAVKGCWAFLHVCGPRLHKVVIRWRLESPMRPAVASPTIQRQIATSP